MSILAIDAAGARAGICLLDDSGEILFRCFIDLQPGLIETLPVLLADRLQGRRPTAMAVGIGPGSFTGLRTSIALACGYAAAAGISLYGVTTAEAFAQALPELGRPLWVAIRARKDRIFLLRDGTAEAFADENVPRSRSAIALAGSAANDIAARLAAADVDVMLTNVKAIDPAWVARAALARAEAGLPPHAAQPLYIDPPEAKRPAAGLRPAPV